VQLIVHRYFLFSGSDVNASVGGPCNRSRSRPPLVAARNQRWRFGRRHGGRGGDFFVVFGFSVGCSCFMLSAASLVMALPVLVLAELAAITRQITPTAGFCSWATAVPAAGGSLERVIDFSRSSLKLMIATIKYLNCL